jgi:hypothetical protein
MDGGALARALTTVSPGIYKIGQVLRWGSNKKRKGAPRGDAP